MTTVAEEGNLPPFSNFVSLVGPFQVLLKGEDLLLEGRELLSRLMCSSFNSALLAWVAFLDIPHCR